MELFLNNKVFFVRLLLMIFLEEPFVQAFSSTKCSHIQIETHVKLTLNCIMKSQNKKVKEFSELQKNIKAVTKDQHLNKSRTSVNNETTELCGLFDEEITCFTDYLGECLDKEVTNDLAEVMEYYLDRQHYIGCSLMKGGDKEEVLKKIMYLNNYTQEAESLNKMFIFDKECSNEELVISFKSKWPCIMVHLSAIMEEVMPHTMPHIIGEELCPSCPKPSQPKSIQICKTVVGMLNTCFGGTECISQREMDLIRDFLTTYYNVIMGFTVQMSAMYGSVLKVYHPSDTYAGMDREMKESANITDLEKMGIKLSGLMVEDYKVLQKYWS